MQAKRVEARCLALFGQVAESLSGDREAVAQRLGWAARLHEIGLSIAHNGYHKHGAYILQNADMPGFSKREQAALALLVRAQRGSLAKVPELLANPAEWPLVMILRLAVLFHRSRGRVVLPAVCFEWGATGGRLLVERQWLARNPLSEAALADEAKEWKGLGVSFKVATAK
jgi:exopolyphosphatase/guanosine-5'-triphosphate,3'-diphosphate pyrophosphatase